MNCCKRWRVLANSGLLWLSWCSRTCSLRPTRTDSAAASKLASSTLLVMHAPGEAVRRYATGSHTELRIARRASTRIDPIAISADHLGSGMLAQPCDKRIRGWVLQQIDAPMGWASTRIVAYRRPRRSANSSTPRTRGTATDRSGTAHHMPRCLFAPTLGQRLPLDRDQQPAEFGQALTITLPTRAPAGSARIRSPAPGPWRFQATGSPQLLFRSAQAGAQPNASRHQTIARVSPAEFHWYRTRGGHRRGWSGFGPVLEVATRWRNGGTLAWQMQKKP
jgi:hypothetical protein